MYVLVAVILMQYKNIHFFSAFLEFVHFYVSKRERDIALTFM